MNRDEEFLIQKNKRSGGAVLPHRLIYLYRLSESAGAGGICQSKEGYGACDSNVFRRC